MPQRTKKQGQPLGFEETLWKAADTLRGSHHVSVVELAPQW